MKLNQIAEMFVVGQSSDVDGEPILDTDRRPVTFCTSFVTLRCGFSVNGDLSIGHNGLQKRIRLDDFAIHQSKESIMNYLDKQKFKVADIYPIEHEIEHVFTHAVVNNIFRRLCIWKAWVHKDWTIKQLPAEIGNLGDDLNVLKIIDNDVNPYKTTIIRSARMALNERND